MRGDHMPLGTDIYNAIESRPGPRSRRGRWSRLRSGAATRRTTCASPSAGWGRSRCDSTTLLAIIHDTARCLIHHGFNRLIFVNGHTSNTKVTDPVFRNLRYETGALLAMFKPYGERYLGLIEDVMENPPEETPGWHASEQETSIMLAFEKSNVKMERVVDTRRRCARVDAGRFRQGRRCRRR